MKSKVEKITPAGSWDYQGKMNYNFILKFVGEEQRYVTVSKDEKLSKVSVGQEIEYEAVPGKTVRGNVSGTPYDLPRINLTQQQQPFGVGNKGGGYRQKNPEELRNDIPGYVGRYATDIICHRTNLGSDPASIVKVFDELATGMYNSLSKLIK